MVSINGLPPSQIPGSGKARKTGKTDKKTSVSKQTPATPATQTTPVANAVSNGIRKMDEADIQRNQIQYDLPDGHNRKALQEYFNVINQAKREELQAMLGVDLYV